MAYKWKPSASQRRAFAERMKDPSEQTAYNDRKRAAKEKRQASSKFSYHTAGGMYIPTAEQHNFVLGNYHLFVTPEQQDAANQVLSGYACKEKVHHDYIHIVNEVQRNALAS